MMQIMLFDIYNLCENIIFILYYFPSTLGQLQRIPSININTCWHPPTYKSSYTCTSQVESFHVYLRIHLFSGLFSNH